MFQSVECALGAVWHVTHALYLSKCMVKQQLKIPLIMCEVISRNNLLVTFSLSQKQHGFCDCLLSLSPKIYMRVSKNCQESLKKATEY